MLTNLIQLAHPKICCTPKSKSRNYNKLHIDDRKQVKINAFKERKSTKTEKLQLFLCGFDLLL